MTDPTVHQHETAAQIAGQAAHLAHEHAVQAVNAIQLPNHWPAQSDLLAMCQQMGPGLAALLVLLGVVYLLFGYNIYKGLIVLNAAVLGAAVGATLGEGVHSELPLAIVGGVAAAAITWPMMKWAVAIMGGLFGALIGAGLWRMCGLEVGFQWAGALIGLISLGLLTFILFRGCVMMYTSLQGAMMLITGLLGLTYKYQDLAPRITESMALKPFLLPLAIFVPTIIGLVYQQHNGATAIAPPKKQH